MKKHDLTKTHLHRASPGMALYAAFAGVTMAAMLCQPVFAATVWESHNRTYNLLRAMFPTLYHEEERKAQELCRAESDPQTAMLNTTAAEKPQ